MSWIEVGAPTSLIGPGRFGQADTDHRPLPIRVLTDEVPRELSLWRSPIPTRTGKELKSDQGSVAFQLAADDYLVPG
jgi:hypothetical protein